MMREGWNGRAQGLAGRLRSATIAVLATAALVLVTAAPAEARAQGCVSARQCSLDPSKGEGIYLAPGQWEFGLSHRWQRSNRHFRDNREEKHRQEANSEVIINMNVTDLLFSYGWDERTSITLDIPYMSGERNQPTWGGSSPLFNPDERNRYHTQGIGDVSLVVRCWLKAPAEAGHSNLSLGFGIKAPTGEDHFTVVRLRGQGDGSIQEQVGRADQALQPGDGGWGFILDAQGFRPVGPTVGYLSATYLLNPQRDSGLRGTSTSSKNTSHLMSIPDQYLFRTGLSSRLPWSKGLAASLGLRFEGVPVYDLVGSSDGFRRPGYALSVEPTLAYAWGHRSFFVSMPWALERNRQRSVPDMLNGGTSHGDAAFADYLLVVGYSVRF